MPASFDAREFLAGFLVEAAEHLVSANQNLLAVEAMLQKGQPHPRAVRDLYRSLHTIKGLASMVGIEPIVDISHAMEAVLRAADRGGGRLAPGMVDVLLKGTRAIEEAVGALEHGRPLAPAPATLLDALALLPAQAPQAAPSSEETFTLDPALRSKLGLADKEQITQGLLAGRHVWRADFVPSPQRAAEGITITTVREAVGRIAEIVKVIPIQRQSAPGIAFALLVVTDADVMAIAQAVHADAEQVVPVVQTAPPPGPEPLGAAEVERVGTIRVEVTRLDDALDKLSALVVTRYRLERATADLAARGADVRALAFVVQENGRQLRHLRAAITRARMISVADMLQRVPLLVRGLAQQTHKQVTLDLQVGRAELDKGVADRIFPAVVHLLRNAVDHALESAAERTAAGKPEAGVLRVSAHEHGTSQLELRVTDDGRGIDRDKVATRAGRPVPHSDEALLELICLPGLSTMDTTTTTSGRGMGMDIIRRITVDQLGGELSVKSVAGAGTTFTLRVPLTVTIIDAFLFMSGNQRFAVPVASVEEIVDLEGARIASWPRPGSSTGVQTRILDRGGTAVPLLALQSVFRLPPDGAGRRAILVRRNGELIAYEVDRMLGQQEVVVRPLEDPLVRRAGLSGATDIGDGKPTLVVDLIGLGGSLLEAEA